MILLKESVRQKPLCAVLVLRRCGTISRAEIEFIGLIAPPSFE